MSRKNYQEFANLISDTLQRYQGSTAATTALSEVAVGMASIFEYDNSRFDADKFYRACHLPELAAN